MNYNARIIRITEEEACTMICDSRIVGIRWDIIPLSIVLDLDVRISEEKDALTRRVWVAFSGLSTLNLPLMNARLPTGLFVTSEMWVDEIQGVKGLRKARFWVLYTKSPEGEENSVKPYEITIVAQKILGVASTGYGPWQDEQTIATWKNRMSLASDDDLRESLLGDEK